MCYRAAFLVQTNIYLLDLVYESNPKNVRFFGYHTFIHQHKRAIFDSSADPDGPLVDEMSVS